MSAATHIEVEAGVRYWEDAEVNGIGDDDGTLIPGRDGDAWKVSIDLTTGKIENWPQGTTASIHYKVCDAGIYWLTDAAGKRLAKWRGYYVPDDFLCHETTGYGDYIILTIGADGAIKDFERPLIDDNEWTWFPASVDTHPKDGDGEATAPLVSGAVPQADAQNPPKG